MPISKTHARRPRRRVTPDDTPLSPRPKDMSRPFGASHRPPPQAILDKIAEETLHKGFTGPRHPLCQVCFTRKSSLGACNCPSDIRASDVKRYTHRVARSPMADVHQAD